MEKTHKCIDIDLLEDLMLRMGFPDNIKGTPIIREAVIMRAWHPDRKLIDDIYTTIALRSGSTPSRIDRNVRTACAIMAANCPDYLLREVFGGCVSLIGPSAARVPTPALVIARLARMVEVSDDDN